MSSPREEVKETSRARSQNAPETKRGIPSSGGKVLLEEDVTSFPLLLAATDLQSMVAALAVGFITTVETANCKVDKFIALLVRVHCHLSICCSGP